MPEAIELTSGAYSIIPVEQSSVFPLDALISDRQTCVDVTQALGSFDSFVQMDDLLLAPVGAAQGEAANSGASDVRELPPPPSGAALTLSGLLTLGAYGTIRSARNIHWAAFPDWYNENGPEQIGYTFVFELEYTPVPLCWFDQGVMVQPSIPTIHRRQADTCRLLPQVVLPATKARGPPVLA